MICPSLPIQSFLQCRASAFSSWGLLYLLTQTMLILLGLCSPCLPNLAYPLLFSSTPKSYWVIVYTALKLFHVFSPQCDPLSQTSPFLDSVLNTEGGSIHSFWAVALISIAKNSTRKNSELPPYSSSIYDVIRNE